MYSEDISEEARIQAISDKSALRSLIASLQGGDALTVQVVKDSGDLIISSPDAGEVLLHRGGAVEAFHAVLRVVMEEGIENAWETYHAHDVDPY